MTKNFRKKIRKLIKKGEGCIPHMYLDSVGKVTVAVGNMLPTAYNAAPLKFVNEETLEVAEAVEIIAEYDNVSKQEKGRVAGYYKQFTSLILPDKEIDALLDHRLDQFEEGLKRDFPDYDSYPVDARLGLMDMAFNLGNHGLISKFPSFTKAAREGNWEICARECRRKQIQLARNDEVKELFQNCIKPDSSQ